MFSALPLHAVRLNDPLFAPRIAALVTTGLPHQFRMIKESGRLENFLRVARKERGSHVGRRYDDSDVYKWLEAVAYVLAHHPDPSLQTDAETVISAITAAQTEDGYLNTFIQLQDPEARWTRLTDSHEVYCLGHLIEAGVAWKSALGDDRLLNVSVRAATLLEGTLGANGVASSDGHAEAELALHRLAELTGDSRWRRLADRMLDQRGTRPSPFEAEYEREKSKQVLAGAFHLGEDEGGGVYNGEYIQDHLPIRDHRTIVGHAVRAAYLYTGAAMSLHQRDDPALLEALQELWANTTARRMYITGGIGSSAHNEGFTRDYDLPNRSAYAETCAAIALALWGREMGDLTGDSDYADVTERALLNGVLAGIAPTGDRYFYGNPLESRGEHARDPWFECACCPPNAARILGRITDFAFGVAEGALRVDLPLAGEYGLGESGRFTIEGRYPEDGRSRFRFDLKRRLTLHLRIPAWADDIELDAPDELGEAEYDRGYAVLNLPAGKTELEFYTPFVPRFWRAHPAVLDDAGLVAVTVGPTVMAAVGETDARVRLPHHALDLERNAEPDGLGSTLYAVDPELDTLYSEVGEWTYETGKVKMVPYRDWANDGPCDMAVWMRTTE